MGPPGRPGEHLAGIAPASQGQVRHPSARQALSHHVQSLHRIVLLPTPVPASGHDGSRPAASERPGPCAADTRVCPPKLRKHARTDTGEEGEFVPLQPAADHQAPFDVGTRCGVDRSRSASSSTTLSTRGRVILVGTLSAADEVPGYTDWPYQADRAHPSGASCCVRQVRRPSRPCRARRPCNRAVASH